MTPAPRVRFCPAPSGWLHVGGARTALFNWLWARHTGGTFVLRIEDTDAERATIESAEGMMQALEWLGLTWDEGPGIGSHEERGGQGPYLQSARQPLHRAVARRLVEAGHAYEAFDTTEELEAAREAGGAGHVYRAPALTDEQVARYRSEGRVPVIRVRTPDGGGVSWEDGVRGTVTFDWTEIGDFVVARADGSPTYMLANVVDDLAQGIGFVARGEDLLSATPRQIHLARILTASGILEDALEEVGHPVRPDGAPDEMTYAHLPLLVGEDRKKLSKRHGDVAIEAFRAEGILPEVMLNFLALCGWSAGDDRERYSVPELVEAFSFDRVRSSPAFFDTVKLRSLNAEAIRGLDDGVFGDLLVQAFEAEGVVATPAPAADAARIRAFAPLVKERAQTAVDAIPFVAWAFRDEVQWDDKAVAKWLKPGSGAVLDHVTPALAALEKWTPESIMGVFEEAVETLGVGMGKAMQPVRVVVTGTAVSPPLPETLAVLDQGWVVDRVRAGRARVPST